MKSEIRDGMQIEWDAPIEMDDGIVLRACSGRWERANFPWFSVTVPTPKVCHSRKAIKEIGRG